jgi:Penicillin binding protein transpeptidase domain
MTESTGSGEGPGQEPGAAGQDPFAALFRDGQRADPSAETDVVRPPLTWGDPQPRRQLEPYQPPQGPPVQVPQAWTPEPGPAPAPAPAPSPAPTRVYGPEVGAGPAQRPLQGGAQGPAWGPEPERESAYSGGDAAGPVPGPVSGPGPTPDYRESGYGFANDQTGITPVIRTPHDDSDDGMWDPAGPEEPRRSKKKVALVAGGSIGVVGVLALVGVLMTQNGGITSALTGGHSSPTPTPTPTVGFAASGATTAEDVAQTAKAFFGDWEAGRYQLAANFTDDPADAVTALRAYQSGLSTTKLAITPQTVTTLPTAAPSGGASGAATPTAAGTAGTPGTTSAAPTAAAAPSGVQSFSVNATVAAPGTAATTESESTSGAADATGTPSTSPSGTPSAGSTAGGGISAPAPTATWTYSSSLTAYLKAGRWYIKWTPGLLAPNLTATEHLATVAVAPGAGEVTDSDGNNLADISDPGIEDIVSYLKTHVPPGSGTPGLAVELVNAAGTAVPGTADTIKPPVNATSVATTIDHHDEQLALEAVEQKSGSSMVVIQPSTGAILAVANNDGGRDDALGSREAPGSTMKIVTATALFNYGVLTPSTGVACPPVETIQGVQYHNSEGDQEPPGTPFLIDFAQSCNNAFDSQYTNLENLRLEGTAANTYGLNQPWNIGLGPASYFSMPTDSGDESGSELAQEAFGQGKVSASPLAMASVAATVQTGVFHQPYLLASITDKVTGTPLPAQTDAYLKEVMRAVIANPIGTAYGIPFGSTVYGKTGTAEHGPTNMSPNAWFAAVDPGPDVAACALVLDNTMNQDNYGATNAAPEVLHLFDGI